MPLPRFPRPSRPSPLADCADSRFVHKHVAVAKSLDQTTLADVLLDRLRQMVEDLDRRSIPLPVRVRGEVPQIAEEQRDLDCPWDLSPPPRAPPPRPPPASAPARAFAGGRPGGAGRPRATTAPLPAGSPRAPQAGSAWSPRSAVGGGTGTGEARSGRCGRAPVRRCAPHGSSTPSKIASSTRPSLAASRIRSGCTPRRSNPLMSFRSAAVEPT
jgi:hypothetical protein